MFPKFASIALPAYFLSVFAATPLAFASPSLVRRGDCPDDVQPKCCMLYPLMEDLQSDLFYGKCGSMVHKALRSTFHDAMAYSQSERTGGADGSLITFSDIELTYRANTGLREYVKAMKPYLEKHDISAGDLLYFAAALGLTNCKGAPRLDVFLGRPDASGASRDGMIPGPTQPVDAILARMADAGFSASELVALMASHSVAASDNMDPTIPGTPLDSTPSKFDAQFFIETSLKGTSYPGTGNNSLRGEVKSPLPGEMRMKSDFALARDHRTSCQWQSYATDQTKMRSDFKEAMTKLSTLGQLTHELIDCSGVLPEARRLKADMKPHFPADLGIGDVEQSCPASPFPKLETDSRSEKNIKPVEPYEQSDEGMRSDWK